MSLSKKYLASKPECKVTFKLSKKLSNAAEEVNLVGEFNNWDAKSTPMKKLKSGDFTVTINLSKDNKYQFKYLLNKENWLNEPDADEFAPNEFQGENSVVVV